MAEMQAAIDRGPHKSALDPDALNHFRDKTNKKVTNGQARVISWVDIKLNPPPQVKKFPVAAIPHKSRAYRSILDLSFTLHLEDGAEVPSVNSTTTRLAPTGSIDQIGHSLN